MVDDSSPNRRCGALPQPDGSIRWRVWAPKATAVDLLLINGAQRRRLVMTRGTRGYFHVTVPDVLDNQRYAFSLNGGPERPDPCSLWQPDGVHAASAVVRPEHFRWTDRDWGGVSRQRLVLYELHVGTFTAAGTFEAVIPRLQALRELGVTAVELMPVAQFPGTRGWGYDGVALYAAQSSYGGPEGIQKLVDACHVSGLAVFLDVVYNHLGPEGNYLNEFGPYFTDHYRTPWGSAVNYDGAGSDAVRDFVLDNARMWLEEFHFDGLRLDAAHAIFDFGPRHILSEIKETADDIARRTGRTIHVIAESDLNDPRLLLPPERGGYGLDGQWADDFHHAVHSVLTGERSGYYADFGETEQVARAFSSPFLYAGDYSVCRQRRHGAAPPPELTGDCFVVCLQNHDQVGNRARGERLSSLLPSPAQQRLAASLLLLSPYVPLLFMGEEYGEESPFPFFCSFGDAPLIQAVREGRQKEFAAFAFQGHVPDPQGEDTFAAARLSWSWPEGSHGAGLRRLYADLLAARRDWPALQDFATRTVRWLPAHENAMLLELVRGAKPEIAVRAVFNLTRDSRPWPTDIEYRRGKLLLSSEASRYGGTRQSHAIGELHPYECVVLGGTAID